MEYNQFKQLLQMKGIREKETVSQLEDFIEKFPYCQTSHLLLAKALHEQDSIHYDRSLKLAAAYASNREVLRNLIGKRTEETEYEFPLQAKETTAAAESIAASQSRAEEKKEERFEEWYSENEISGSAFIEQKEKEKLVDPHEVIRQRLNEILSGSEIAPEKKEETISDSGKIESEPEKKSEVTDKAPTHVQEPVVEKEIEVPASENKFIPLTEEKAGSIPGAPVDSRDEKKIIAEAENAKDVLDKMELEHAMEESILESLTRLPVIALEKQFGKPLDTNQGYADQLTNDQMADKKSPRSFTDWLKLINNNSAGFEEVRTSAPKPAPIPEKNTPVEAPEPESHLSDDELIEKFLLDNPKIEPSKAEFYSPVNQAKKSVMDHDDVVSETLAKIYLSQGNTRKARWCYERLMLLHPEKSAFFAALLKEIDDQPTNKEDL